MTSFIDDVLGTVTVRRNSLSRSIKMRLSPRGEVIVTAPKYAPLSLIKRTVKHARSELATIQKESRAELYRHKDQIGQSHTLVVTTSTLSGEPTVTLKARTIVVTLPDSTMIEEQAVQTLIRDKVVSILRREAKAYLPKRLRTLAHRHGYTYEKVRFPHAISRWGSCSSSGTISLNISLMKLPLELIDYVILHELAHTKHMNHSDAFWQELATYDPHYRLHRRQIKAYSPIV